MKFQIKSSFAVMVIVSGLIFSACSQTDDLSNSPVMKEVVKEDNLISISEQLSTDKEIKNEEIELFTSAVERFIDTKDSLLGKTVGQLISDQKEFNKNRSLITMKATLAKDQLLLAHKLTYVGSIAEDKDPNQKLDFLVYEVQNTSKKEISDVQGVLQFFNKMNQIVKVYPIQSKQVMSGKTIKPGEVLRLAFPFFHSDTNSRDQFMRSTEPKIAVWQPTVVEFKDSTKFSMPKADVKQPAKK